jgi:hypothetical protein
MARHLLPCPHLPRLVEDVQRNQLVPAVHLAFIAQHNLPTTARWIQLECLAEGILGVLCKKKEEKSEV